MQLEGHTKRESLALNAIEPDKLSKTARALFDEFARAKESLDSEASRTEPHQSELGLGGGNDDDLDDNRIDARTIMLRNKFLDLSRELHNETLPADVYVAVQKADAAESLAKKKPTAPALVDILGKPHVVTFVAGQDSGLPPMAILHLAVAEEEYQGEKRTSYDESDGMAGFAGIVFTCDKKKYVVGSVETRICVKPADPLAGVGTEDVHKTDEPLVNYDKTAEE